MGHFSALSPAPPSKGTSTLFFILTIRSIGFCKNIVNTLVKVINFTHRIDLKNSMFG